MKSEPERILIVGYGNELRSDDAVGRHAARELGRGGIAAIDVHQLAPELTEPLSEVDLVYFIDASTALAPGAVQVRAIEETSSGILDHHVAPGGLLRLCRELYGRAPRALLITIGGQSFEFGIGLSQPAMQAVQEVVDRLRNSLPPSPCDSIGVSAK